jgi:hypothetical protein
MISAATIPTTLIYSRFRGNGTTLFSRLEDRISCVKGRGLSSSDAATVKFEKKGEIFLVAMRSHPQQPNGEDYRYFDLDGATLAKRSHAPPAPIPKVS